MVMVSSLKTIKKVIFQKNVEHDDKLWKRTKSDKTRRKNDDKVWKATQNDGDRRRQTTTSESPIEPESNSNSSKVDFIMLFWVLPEQPEIHPKFDFRTLPRRARKCICKHFLNRFAAAKPIWKGFRKYFLALRGKVRKSIFGLISGCSGRT